MNLWKKIRQWIPLYAVPWLLGVAAAQFGTFYITKLLLDGSSHCDLTSRLDLAIPFVPIFAIPYVLAFPSWVVSYILIARESQDHCKRVLTGDILAKLLSLPFFIFLPTTLVRPEPVGTDFFSWLCRLVYLWDTPTNLLPSFHCLISYICWRGLWGCKKIPRWLKTFNFLFAILVFASTVLIKQHILIDIPTGILMGELGLQLSRLIYRKREVSL